MAVSLLLGSLRDAGRLEVSPKNPSKKYFSCVVVFPKCSRVPK